MRLRVLFYARVCYSTLASTTCTVTTFTDFTFVTVAAVRAGARVSVSFSPSPNPTLTTDSDLTQPQTPTLSRPSPQAGCWRAERCPLTMWLHLLWLQLRRDGRLHLLWQTGVLSGY